MASPRVRVALLVAVAAGLILAGAQPSSHARRTAAKPADPSTAAPAAVDAPPSTTTTTTVPPTPAQRPPAAFYVVQAGDTVSAIAAAHGLNAEAVCAANRLPDCNLIYPGQRLSLDASERAAPPSAPVRSTPKPAGNGAAGRTGEAGASGSQPPPTSAPGFGCGPALAYLAAHAAPGFTFVCHPGAAYGHYGMTCVNHPPQCGVGSKVIYISCPDPVVYQNESQNSWVLTGGPGRIDAYGQRPSVGYGCNGIG